MGNKNSSSFDLGKSKNKKGAAAEVHEPIQPQQHHQQYQQQPQQQQHHKQHQAPAPPTPSAGMQKAKQYDWKDSNMALFGSDTDKKVKKESAQTEPAWKGAGHQVGLKIWRIVKFKVTDWPKEDYGKFYDGDSYIILNTYKEEGSNALLFDVHFWIGKYSTQDEYGTAAYKTVELDTLLDDVPVQHREVQDHESELFRSYFKTIELLSGGADSGFRHVTPQEYQPRLLHFHGDKHGVRVKEIPKCKDLLDENDVYILDSGTNLVQWNGSGANKDERFKASNYLSKLSGERSGKIEKEVMDGGQDDADFMKHLKEGKQEEHDYKAADPTNELFRLSNASGSLTFTKEKTGNVTKSDFDSDDVFIFDTKDKLFVWIGAKTTHEEKQNAMTYAHNYLMKTDHPLVPVSCFNEKKLPSDFRNAIAA